MGVIKRLPEIVVNRIAAGEVVVRPANAVKELLENSLDAEATEIVVTVKQGGLDLIQIQDNGKGIYKDDLELVCERFTTSKLKEFEDLQNMQTYGFRGEALASISLVSKVSVTSKPKDQQVAYQGKYIDGKAISVRPSAGQGGTVITAEELFYNCQSRRSAFRNHNEETARIAEVVTKYAVFRPNVVFALRKGTSGNDFRTSGDGSRKTVVTQLLGKQYAEDLVDINHESTNLRYKMTGCFSRPTAAATSTAVQARKDRRKQFFIFINGRDVQCPLLKHGFEKVLNDLSLVYSFVIISLEMDPSRIDVNVHPTKQNVIFIDEDYIVDDIKNYFTKLLGDFSECNLASGRQVHNSSLTNTQITRIPGFSQETLTRSKSDDSVSESQTVLKKRADYMNIRTDSKEQRLDQFLSNSQEFRNSLSQTVLVPVSSSQVEEGSIQYKEESGTCRRVFTFDSLANLRREVCLDTCQELRDFFKSLTFVGCLDPEQTLVQYATSLYMFNLQKIAEEMFYQSFLFSFGNFGSFRLDNGGISVEHLFLMHTKNSDTYEHEKARDGALFLGEHAEMLNDFVSVCLEFQPADDNPEVLLPYIVGIPSVIDGYVPQLEGLPSLIYDLICKVDWESEEACFRGLCRALGKFYSIKKQFCDETLLSGLNCKVTWKGTIEELILPRLRNKLIPLKKFKEEVYLTRLTDLHDLYKVFERC